MKILQINKFFFLKGGAERHFFDLSNLLEEKGHQVLVWSVNHAQNFAWPDQTNFVNFYDYSKKEGFLRDLKKVCRIFWNFEAQKKLRRIIREEKPDIVHLHNVYHQIPLSIILTLKKYRLPVVMTLHDYNLFCPNYKFFSQGKVCFDCLSKKNYWSCLFKKCVKNSYLKSFICALKGIWQKDFLKLAKEIDGFIAPSLFMKNRAKEWGIAKEKIFYLPNFITEEEHKKSIRKNDLPKTSPYFLYFGRLSQEKGLDMLIRVFIKVLDKHPSWQLKIAGCGPDKENLEKLAKSVNLKIEFLGQKSKNQLKKIIAQSYLTILPVLWPENLPFGALESFIEQKPIIAARIGGLTQLVRDQETGLLFKPNNEKDLRQKIEWAISHPKQISQMGEKAKEKVLLEHNEERYYQQLIKIYERIKNN